MADPAPLFPTIETTTATQFLQAILVSLAWVFDAQQTFINVFTDANPTWHCSTPTCPTTSTPCTLPPNTWAWDHPTHTSIVSEWSLQCSSPALIGLPASSFFAGCLAGGLLLATLADSILGRKTMLFLACLTMSLTAALTVAAPNVYAYAALRFISGAARASVGTSSLVLATEIVGKRWRDRISIVGFFCFTLGFLSLPAMAYVGRDSSWRSLYLWTSVPSLCYSLSIHFFVQESPRWLLVRGQEKNVNVDIFQAFRILWVKKWARLRLAAIMTVGFGVGIVYYGMPLNLGNLGRSSSLYLSVTFNALAELPSSLITFFIIGVMNRKSSSLVFTTVSGVCSIVCVFVKGEGVRMGVEVVAFFSACTAFNVVLIYSIELFPTCVRNSAISMVRQALVFGGVFAPVVVALGRERSGLSFGVFGLVIGCCGLFVACLPETRGGSMSDTMEEEEYKAVESCNSSP